MAGTRNYKIYNILKHNSLHTVCMHVVQHLGKQVLKPEREKGQKQIVVEEKLGPFAGF